MNPPPDTRLGTVVHTLTTVAGLCLAGWAAFLLRQISFARRVADSQLADEWERRIEILSFLVVVPNVAIFVPAAVAAATATWLAGPTQELPLAIILRLVRWSSALLVAIGVVSIFSSLINEVDSPAIVEEIAAPVGGILVASAMYIMCRDAGRETPGG